MSLILRNAITHWYKNTINLVTRKTAADVQSKLEFNFSNCPTVLGQCIDVLDVFTDILLTNKSRKVEDVRKPINNYTNSTDINIVKKLNYSLKNPNEDTVKVCDDCIHEALKYQSYNDACKVLDFCKSNKVVVSPSTLNELTENFVKMGSKDGLLRLKSLCKIINPQEYLKQGQYLYYLSKVAWTNNDMKECISLLDEFFTLFPDQFMKVKRFLTTVMEQTVTTCSEAQLIILTDFVKHFCLITNNHQLLSVLWISLFQSDLFADQQLADQLLDEYKQLNIYVQLMCVPLSKHFLFRRKDHHVYRLLRTLLKLEMKDEYKRITRCMFDCYRMQGYELGCAELVKSSVTLNIPLRDDQYKKFISYSMYGNTYQKVKPDNIMKYLQF